jgi:hypothetical protein
MITSVKLEGYYNRSKDVPRIGQRKQMRVNGKVQTMILNKIEATRSRPREFNEKTLQDEWITEFNTTEFWGEFYI